VSGLNFESGENYSDVFHPGEKQIYKIDRLQSKRYCELVFESVIDQLIPENPTKEK